MKILVSYDDSNTTQKALALAKNRAKAFNAQVYVVHSMEKGTEALQKKIQAAERNLEKVKDFFLEDDIPCETRLLIRNLSPGEDLVQFSIENKIDEIIIRLKKTSKVQKLFLGSNAQYIILNAPCPVSTIK